MAGGDETASFHDSTSSVDVGTAETLPAPRGEPSGLEVDDCVGRYTIRSKLGSGGMGDVYAAYDPELDRLVAVKVLRDASTQSAEARLRFQREAKAMARLNHPNVVTVYDVGAIRDRTFVAMELVEGTTLAAWLAERPRTVAEVLDVFLQAGRGLAAAHAAGITHRDFKPANVMLGERVRVVDFGLARSMAGEPVAEVAPTVLDATVTDTGGVVGTPAYMAPEQRTSVAGPAADQYSFALSLREALTGVHPSTPETAAARAIPARLRPVLERALAVEPDHRFPSMTMLLGELERATGRRRQRWIVGAIAFGALATLAVVPLMSRSTDPCTGAEDRMVGVWDPFRREGVRAAFASTRLPYAARTWERVASALDQYRAEWLDSHVATCRATRIEGRQSEALLDRRMTCLERGLSMLRALSQVWIDGVDPSALEGAGDAPASLPAVSACARDQTLLDQPALPDNLAATAKIAGIRADLDRLRALQLAGRTEQAAKQLSRVVAAADETQWAPVRAEAHYLQAQVSSALRTPATETDLLEANKLAVAARDDLLAAEALVDLVNHLALDQQSAQRALLVAELAEAAVARAGNDDRLRIKLLRHRGDAYYTADKLPQATAAFTQARELAIRRYGEHSAEALAALTKLSGAASQAGRNADSRKLAQQSLAETKALVGAQHPSVAAILNELGLAAYNQDDYDAAADYFTQALAITAGNTGEDSLPTSVVLMNIGNNEMMRGHLDNATSMLERTLKIRERLLGPDDPKVGQALGNLSGALQQRGELDQALAARRRGLAIYTRTYGPEHRQVAAMLQGLGRIFGQMGNAAEALNYHQQALAVYRKVLGDNHPLTAWSMVQVAEALRATGRCREVEPLLSAAITGLEQAGSDTSPGLEQRGECELEGGRPREAVASARRSIAACERTSATSPECASKYWLLARALDASGQRSEAIQAATRAIERAPDIADSASRFKVSTVRAWLAARTR